MPIKKSFEAYLFSNTVIFLFSAVNLVFFLLIGEGQLEFKSFIPISTCEDNTCGTIGLLILAIAGISFSFINPKREWATYLHEMAHYLMAKILRVPATFVPGNAYVNVAPTTSLQWSLISLSPLFLVVLGTTVANLAVVYDIQFIVKILVIFVGIFIWESGNPSATALSGFHDWENATINGSKVANYMFLIFSLLAPLVLSILLMNIMKIFK